MTAETKIRLCSVTSNASLKYSNRIIWIVNFIHKSKLASVQMFFPRHLLGPVRLQKIENTEIRYNLNHLLQGSNNIIKTLLLLPILEKNGCVEYRNDCWSTIINFTEFYKNRSDQPNHAVFIIMMYLYNTFTSKATFHRPTWSCSVHNHDVFIEYFHI